MSHNHENNRNYNRAFLIGVILNVAFVIIEFTYGVISDSLALISDAGHNFTDVLGLLLAWGASLIALKKPTQRRTYGFRRVTILASLLSSILLLMAMGVVVWEAIGRFDNPSEINGLTIIVVAGIGVVINAITALLFLSGKDKDLNLKGAYLHMAADAGVSFGVVLAGIGILLTGWVWLDPAISLIIVAIILYGTWGLFRDSVNLVIDTVPKNINPEEVEKYLNNLPGVERIHDLHIWAMSTTEVALTAHLVIPEKNVDDDFLNHVCDEINKRFGIMHSTFQVEKGNSEISRKHEEASSI